jgi:hypothetical protein
MRTHDGEKKFIFISGFFSDFLRIGSPGGAQ